MENENKLHRRDFLKLACVSFGVFLLSGCGIQDPDESTAQNASAEEENDPDRLIDVVDEVLSDSEYYQHIYAKNNRVQESYPQQLYLDGNASDYNVKEILEVLQLTYPLFKQSLELFVDDLLNDPKVQSELKPFLVEMKAMFNASIMDPNHFPSQEEIIGDSKIIILFSKYAGAISSVNSNGAIGTEDDIKSVVEAQHFIYPERLPDGAEHNSGRIHASGDTVSMITGDETNSVLVSKISSGSLLTEEDGGYYYYLIPVTPDGHEVKYRFRLSEEIGMYSTLLHESGHTLLNLLAYDSRFANTTLGLFIRLVREIGLDEELMQTIEYLYLTEELGLEPESTESVGMRDRWKYSNKKRNLNEQAWKFSISRFFNRSTF